MEVAAGARPETLTDVLDQAAALMVAASAEALRAVAAHDRQQLWRRDRATSMTGWLAARYCLAWGTGREWVRVAHALERLPRIAEAYACGRLSLPASPPDPLRRPETDQYWARRAPAFARGPFTGRPPATNRSGRRMPSRPTVDDPSRSMGPQPPGAVPGADAPR